MVPKKTLESHLDSKEIKPVNSKGNQPWIFIWRTNAEAEAPIFWPPDAKSQLTGKDPDAGKDWRQEEKGATRYEMVGWHHQFNGHEFESTPGDIEGQGSLVCCSSWGRKESNMTDWTTANTEFTVYSSATCVWVNQMSQSTQTPRPFFSLFFLSVNWIPHLIWWNPLTDLLLAK